MFAKAIITHEPEHRRMLRASAADLLADRPLTEVRRLAEERSFDLAFHKKLCELGWIGMMHMSEGELDASDAVALHRELGRKALPEPVVACGILATGVLAEAKNPAFAGELDRICGGEIVATLAWQGASGALDASGCGPVAERTADGWTVNGAARFVPWASRSDAIIVAARSEDGVVLGWLPAGADGLTVQPAYSVDKTEASTVQLQNVPLPTDAVIASGAEGAACLDRVLDLARLAVSAEMVGAGETVFQMTLDYLRERKQFGRAIGANQALQFAATDIFVQLELANSVLANAAALFASDAENASSRIAACKARCGDAAFLAARGAIQMHGAIGYTHECDVSVYVKKIMHLNAFIGSPVYYRKGIGSLYTSALSAAA